MNERSVLSRKLSAAQFAAWELHIYLDTHPCDRTANDMFRKYTNEAALLKAEYEKRFGPLTVADSENVEWLSDPWPWENEGGEQ